ncbi:uncharacterized protein LOC135685609 [Rhopilema esculentum]|uniref:uncharacterized protein LOC135685609 n=1 Tax=Rhopilema esculentum TaxID=499914 RepID=UPI0031CF84A2
MKYTKLKLLIAMLTIMGTYCQYKREAILQEFHLSQKYICQYGSKLALSASSELHCVNRCLREDACETVNFFTGDTTDQLNCEIFSESKDAKGCSLIAFEAESKAIKLKRLETHEDDGLINRQQVMKKSLIGAFVYESPLGSIVITSSLAMNVPVTSSGITVAQKLLFSISGYQLPETLLPSNSKPGLSSIVKNSFSAESASAPKSSISLHPSETLGSIGIPEATRQLRLTPTALITTAPTSQGTTASGSQPGLASNGNIQPTASSSVGVTPDLSSQGLTLAITHEVFKFLILSKESF